MLDEHVAIRLRSRTGGPVPHIRMGAANSYVRSRHSLFCCCLADKPPKQPAPPAPAAAPKPALPPMQPNMAPTARQRPWRRRSRCATPFV